MEAESPPVVIVDVVGVVVVGVPLEGAFLPLMLLGGGAGATFPLKLLRLDPPGFAPQKYVNKKIQTSNPISYWYRQIYRVS